MVKRNILVGIGNSKKKNPYEAAKEAVAEALQTCPKPTFSIVYTNSDLDQNGFLKGLNEILGTNWVGCSADKMFNSKAGYDPELSISVLCMQSEYMHFSVEVAEKYRDEPKKKGFQAAEKAIQNIKGNNYLDAYIQFTRAKKEDYSNIVRNPPYFILTFISGAQIIKEKNVAGEETEFLEGILDYASTSIPIFGGSASSSFEKYFEGIASNCQFAKGRLYKDSAIVVFVISNLHFSTMITHGYETTKDFAAITKIDKTGYEILEINGKEPVAEYAKLIGVSKEKYLKNPERHSLSRPFGTIQEDGASYIKEALPNPNGKTMHSTFKLYRNAMLNVLKINEKQTVNASKNALDLINAEKNNSEPAIAFFCNCSGRRMLENNIENKDLLNLRKKHNTTNFFGFYSFGEIGSSKINSAQLHSQTVSVLGIYNKIITE